MSETRATTPVFPAGRYGRRRDGRRRLAGPIALGLIIVVGAVALLFRVWGTWGSHHYEAQIVRWTNVTESQMTIDFTVNVPAGGSATCGLRVRDYDGFEVGRRTVTVRATGNEEIIRASEVVTTNARGVVGDVVRCGEPTG